VCGGWQLIKALTRCGRYSRLHCRDPAAGLRALSAGDCGQPAALVKLALGGLGAGLHDICDQRLHDSYLEML